MRIFAAHGRAGSAFYRVLLPLGELNQQPGFDVALKPAYGSISDADFVEADLIVGQRISSPAHWGQAGKSAKLVYELDDDVFSILPENKFAYADYQRPEIRNGTAQCLAMSDLVTVPTEYLAEVMCQYNKNVAVLPNQVPGWAFDLPQSGSRGLRLGWAGGASHERNVSSVAGPVRRFLKRTSWGLRLVGTDYRNLFGQGEFIPWMDIAEQPEAYYAALDFDIGLAPLLDNPFNRCKSPLRPLECAARGIPVIASDVVPYREFIENGVTGFLVRHEHEWLKRLSELAADEDLRLKMGAAAREKARGFSIDDSWRLWSAAYGSRHTKG